MDALKRAKSIIPWVRNKSITQLFLQEQMKNIKFSRYEPGQCIICGYTATEDVICPPCWNNITACADGYCLMCDYMLEPENRKMQQKHPLEIKWRLHNEPPANGIGTCLDLFCLCVAHSLGIDTGILEQHIPRDPDINGTTPTEP